MNSQNIEYLREHSIEIYSEDQYTITMECIDMLRIHKCMVEQFVEFIKDNDRAMKITGVV